MNSPSKTEINRNYIKIRTRDLELLERFYEKIDEAQEGHDRFERAHENIWEQLDLTSGTREKSAGIQDWKVYTDSTAEIFSTWKGSKVNQLSYNRSACYVSKDMDEKLESKSLIRLQQSFVGWRNHIHLVKEDRQMSVEISACEAEMDTGKIKNELQSSLGIE